MYVLQSTCVFKKEKGLTIVAVHSREGGHGAVAGVVLPLLDADAHVGAGILLTRGARTYGGRAQGCNSGADRPAASR